MRVLVTGGRDYGNWAKVHAVLDGLHAKFGIDMVIQGCADGADKHAYTWALNNSVEHTGNTYKPDWDGLGRSAGIQRNSVMFFAEQPHLVVGFPGDEGTRHMTELAAQDGCPTLMIPDPEWEKHVVSLEIDPLDDVMMDDETPLPGADGNPWWLCAPSDARRLPLKIIPLPATPDNRYASLY